MAIRWLVAVMAGLALAGPVKAQAENTPRVGRIIIEGNTTTYDGVIHALVDLHPGQKLSARQLRAAEARLRDCGLFRVNRWRGVGPTVQVVPNEFDSPYFDILVTVEERPGNFLVNFLLVDVPGAIVATTYKLWNGFTRSR